MSEQANKSSRDECVEMTPRMLRYAEALIRKVGKVPPLSDELVALIVKTVNNRAFIDSNYGEQRRYCLADERPQRKVRHRPKRELRFISMAEEIGYGPFDPATEAARA